MKKIFKIILVFMMLVGIGFSFANFVSAPISAIKPDAVYVKRVHDCWDQYQIDCYFVGWEY